MAIVIGELFITLIDEVILDLVADGIVIDVELSNVAILGIQDTLVSEIEAGASDIEALTNAYNSVAELDSTVAAQLAFRLSEEGFQISEENVVEQGLISNGALKANETGVPDSPDIQKFEPTDTPDVSAAKVAANTANAVAPVRSGFGVLGYLGVASITVIIIGILAFFNIIYNGICSTICYLNNKLFNAQTTHCSKANTYTCCSNTKCTTAFCGTISNIRKFFKKYEYGLMIDVSIIIIGLGIAFYNTIGIVWPIIISVFWVAFVWLICGPLGYILVNSFCGLSDLYTIFSHL